MSDLTTDGTCTYNSVDFGAIARLVSVDIKPIEDSAGRLPKYNQYTITLETRVFADQPAGEDSDIGTYIEAMRAQLTQFGGVLHIERMGLGNFQINTLQSDVVWGPKPRAVRLEPEGSKAAWKLTFTVEVHLGECDDGLLPADPRLGILEFCYKVDYGIDLLRYTRKTTTGHIQVAATRRAVDDFSLPDHADRFREQITPAIPFGFRRVSDNWSLSEDKVKLSFSITDEEMPPNLPPPNVLTVEASHTISSTNLGMVEWVNNLSATYEMGTNRSRGECYYHFRDLLNRRLEHARRNSRGFLDRRGRRIGGVVIPLSFSATEPIYGRQAGNFSAAWRLVTDLGTAVFASGLWQRPGDNDWAAWNVSHAAIMGPRGHAGLRFDPNEDSLVNLCSDEDARIDLRGGQRRRERGLTTDPRRLVEEVFDLVESTFPRAGSWLRYSLRVRVTIQDRVAELRPLAPAPRYVPSPPGDAGFQLPFDRGARGEQGGGGGGSAPSAAILQTRVGPSVWATLEGEAVRVLYEISPPLLTKFGGQDVVPANREGVEYFQTEVVANLTLPVVMARWRLRWLVPDVPRGPITSPPNPILGGGADRGPASAPGDIALQR